MHLRKTQRCVTKASHNGIFRIRRCSESELHYNRPEALTRAVLKLFASEQQQVHSKGDHNGEEHKGKILCLQPERLHCTNAPQRDTGTEVVIDIQQNRAHEAMVLALRQVTG